MPAYVLHVAIALLACAAPALSGYGQVDDWTPSPDELAQLRDGAVLVNAEVASDRSAGSVRAAIEIHASAQRIFETLTDCAEALRFVPHLRDCTVLQTAPDGSWQVVEQRIDYGWFMPEADYVFRAQYERFDHICFTHVRGDFRENRGSWVFRPTPDGAATVVIYRAHVEPRFFVPRWLLRATLRRDLPELMKGLRTVAESAENQAAPEPSAGQRSH